MAKPELKQFGVLSSGDFERHPVWIGCHVADYDEPWYEETDEETFRPWTGASRLPPLKACYWCEPSLELRDGTRCSGFVTPAFDEGDLGTQQPAESLWATDASVFGEGCVVCRLTTHVLRCDSTATGRSLPLTFTVKPGLATGVVAGQVQGFYQSTRDGFQVEQ